MTGIPFKALCADDLIESCSVETVLAGVSSLLAEGKHRRKDGSIFDVEVSASRGEIGRRPIVMDGARSSFPLHSLHVDKQRTSCGTCHDAHGSGAGRSLVPFNDEAPIPGVSPSLKTGTLAFISDAPGSGTCYLTCHGRDHAPSTYGISKAAILSERPGTVSSTPIPGGRTMAARRGAGFEPGSPRPRNPEIP